MLSFSVWSDGAVFSDRLEVLSLSELSDAVFSDLHKALSFSVLFDAIFIDMKRCHLVCYLTLYLLT